METLFSKLKNSEKHLIVHGEKSNLAVDDLCELFGPSSTQILAEKYGVYTLDAHFNPEKYIGKKQSDIIIAKKNKIGFFSSFFKALGYSNNYIEDLTNHVKKNIFKPECFEYAPILLEEYKEGQCKKQKVFLNIKNSEYFFTGLYEKQIKDLSYCINEICKDNGKKYPLRICFATNNDLNTNPEKKLNKLKGDIERENLDVVDSYSFCL